MTPGEAAEYAVAHDARLSSVGSHVVSKALVDMRAAVNAIHKQLPMADTPVCEECSVPWLAHWVRLPCPTVAAVEAVWGGDQ